MPSYYGSGIPIIRTPWDSKNCPLYQGFLISECPDRGVPLYYQTVFILCIQIRLQPTYEILCLQLQVEVLVSGWQKLEMRLLLFLEIKETAK